MSHIDNGVIRLYSHSGLCNRLRLFSSYRKLSEEISHKIEMHWVTCVQCRSTFDDLFEPIEDIQFVYKSHQKNRRKSRPKNSAISVNKIKEEELCKYYIDIKPKKHILEKVSLLKDQLGDNYVSCHVRRTDICTIQKKYNIEANSDEDFFSFLDKNSYCKYFLATDNKETQWLFKDRYGDRVIFSNEIVSKSSKRWPVRTTTIETAVVDLFTCIGSSGFMGTNCSSFSEFIEKYRKGLKCRI